jgi:hypothetical protein
MQTPNFRVARDWETLISDRFFDLRRYGPVRNSGQRISFALNYASFFSPWKNQSTPYLSARCP